MTQKTSGADAPDPDHEPVDWNTGQANKRSPSLLEDPRASDPLGLSQLCAERQAEAAANGKPTGWTVPNGENPVVEAMIEEWVACKGVTPETIPKKLLEQYYRAMQKASTGFSVTPEQAAQAVRYVLTHPDYAWYAYSHPAVAKFGRDVQGVLVMILSGVDLSSGNAENRPYTELTGLEMVRARKRQRQEQRSLEERSPDGDAE